MSHLESYLEYKNGTLHFGMTAARISLADKAAHYRGPVYLYDVGIVRERYGQLTGALPDVQMFYALKANSNPTLLKSLASLGAGADVVSGGEVERALENGFLPEKIIFSGVGKTRFEIRQALRLQIGQINVESLPELLRIIEIATEMKVRAPIALRLNPDVSIQTHPYIATGLKNNKFGLELALLEELTSLLQQNAAVVHFKGISMHLGSQMTDFAGYQEALQKLVGIFHGLRKSFPNLSVFDIGGGLGIIYDRQDLGAEKKSLQEYASITRRELQSVRELGVQIQSEPGRWLVAHAGLLMMQVQYIKKTTHKEFVIVDSGMNHLLRPSLYEAHHAVFSVKEKGKWVMADLVGPICESGDFFAKDRMLPELAQDDFIVIADVGAYGFSMANRYNLHHLPFEEILGE